MDSNIGSPVTGSVTISETFKFNGKWTLLILLVLVGLIIITIVFKCKRGCGEIKLEEAVELGQIGEISKREERLKEMQKLKKQKIQELLHTQNVAFDAEYSGGKFQTELFSHFAKGDPNSSQKKVKGRGRHASKITEEEEDEESLKEEEAGLSGNTRLVTQPWNDERRPTCWFK
ncbi:hypothetical protein J1N35_013439 [Gossypium stocksii]|uniref:Uncharacterized protein n=1 Tax=Gossypium stocksii TaxID=47602 RepID=A0A9D3VTS3_9ROSI|nr:hypothetical protein J1N35_013439 [Gossypium stocksii]